LDVQEREAVVGCGEAVIVVRQSSLEIERAGMKIVLRVLDKVKEMNNCLTVGRCFDEIQAVEKPCHVKPL
jgi:hypothetical protein